jgi:hypothetical protein
MIGILANVMDAEAQLKSFVAKFDEDIAAQIRAARAIMRARLPGAVELAYDNYNALAIAYGASGKLADVVFSLAAYPRWVSLFFAQGAALDDPESRLKGKGGTMRHIVLNKPDLLNDAAVRALMDQALARARTTIGNAGQGRLIIKSVSAKQRPRRP